MRIVLLVIVLVTAPTAAFFLWAWGVKIKQERKLAGTLPAWQELPLTWLAIAGLVFTIAGVLLMFFTQNQGYGGLFAP
jgi:flagellar biosynthesis/type III secretory pathway M-ring protein FliF/YscJ